MILVVSVTVINEMVERQEVQVMVVGKERVGRGELSKVGRGEQMVNKVGRAEQGRDLKKLRLGQEQEKEVPSLPDPIIFIAVPR